MTTVHTNCIFDFIDSCDSVSDWHNIWAKNETKICLYTCVTICTKKKKSMFHIKPLVTNLEPLSILNHETKHIPEHNVLHGGEMHQEKKWMYLCCDLTTKPTTSQVFLSSQCCLKQSLWLTVPHTSGIYFTLAIYSPTNLHDLNQSHFFCFFCLGFLSAEALTWD